VIGGALWLLSERTRSSPTPPVQVTAAIGVEDYPSWSPDGRTLAYHSNQSGTWDIWVTQGGAGQPVSASDDRYPSWDLDGRRIFLGRQDDIWILDLEDGSERPVTDFAGRRGALEKIELHGNTIYFTWRASLGDLWVMDVEQ